LPKLRTFGGTSTRNRGLRRLVDHDGGGIVPSVTTKKHLVIDKVDRKQLVKPRLRATSGTVVRVARRRGGSESSSGSSSTTTKWAFAVDEHLADEHVICVVAGWWSAIGAGTQVQLEQATRPHGDEPHYDCDDRQSILVPSQKNSP
jgi:hypothetical protein